MTGLILGTMIPSLVVTWLAAFAVRKIGPSLGLVDKPGHRKVHSQVMPTCGGLAIWLGIVLPLAVGEWGLWQLRAGGDSASWLTGYIPQFAQPHLAGLATQSGRLWILIAGATILMVLGLLDDRWGLDWRLRISVQTLVAVATVALGFRISLYMDLPWLTGTLTVLWIVGLINSFNMLDNMDGLSAGVAAIAALLLAIVMLIAPAKPSGPQLFVGGFLFVVVGALLGFLWHNRSPARLFMGDTGAYLIGYLLAVTTISATFAGENIPPHAILAPLCVLAVPLYDTITVIYIRLRSGRSPFVGDKSHFSHRLVELGMTKPQAVATIYLTTATCGLGALLLHQVQWTGALVIVLLVGCTLVLVGILETTGRRQRNGDNGDSHG